MKWLAALVIGGAAFAALAQESGDDLAQLNVSPQTGVIELDAEAEAALKQQTETLTETYLGQLDAAEYNDAWLQYDPIAKQVFDIDKWIGQRKVDKDNEGKRKTLDIWRVTVYKNPQDAPSPGNYIAVDYDSEFEKMPLVCGYVMWYQNLKGELTIMREEKGYLTAGMLEQIPAGDLPAIKEQIGCRGE